MAWAYWDELAENTDRTDAGLPRLRTLCPTPEMLAALEAVRAVMSDARAGELECHGRTVPPHVVEEWMRSRLRDRDLDGLLAEIEYGPARRATADGSARTPLRDAALEQLQRRHVMRIAELATATGATTDEIQRLVTAGEPLFGSLGAPPVIVFERFAATASQPSGPTA